MVTDRKEGLLGLCVFDETQKQFIFLANADCMLTSRDLHVIAKHLELINQSPSPQLTYHVNTKLQFIPRP